MSSTDMAAVDPERDPLPEGKLLRLNDWAESLGWVLAVAAALAGLFLLLVDPASPRSDGSLRPLLGLVWLAFGLFMAAGSRAGLVAERDGVTVRTLLRAHRYPWHEIDEARLSSSWLSPGLVLRLRSGKRHRIVSLSPGSAQERKLAEAIVAELNRRVAAAASPASRP